MGEAIGVLGEVVGGGEDLTDNRSTDLDSKIEMSFRAKENGISPHDHIQRIQRIYALKDGNYWQICHFQRLLNG